jgi:hypothetical protein
MGTEENHEKLPPTEIRTEELEHKSASRES